MSTDGHRPPRAAALCAATAVALCLTTLVVSGRSLPFPDSTDTAELARWARTVGTATVAFTALRAIAMALFGWWVLAWVLGVVARRTRRHRLVALVDRLSPRLVRHLAEAALGIGVVVGGLAPAAGAGAAAPAPAVVMVDLGPSMTDLGTVEPPIAEHPTATVPTIVTPPPDVVVPEAPAPASTWTVEPGDTLWRVAEVTATEALGRPADTAEIARRLDRLVALNADRLAVPGDPSLVFPGQEFLLD